MPIFTHAIVRQPGPNFAEGLTNAQLGKPNFELARVQHAAYCSALEGCGLQLTILEADPHCPDGCFVEDTAIVTEEVAIITRPGDPSRRGEPERIAEVLRQHKPIERIIAPACVEGGDVMRVGQHFYIGLSQRTNEGGVQQLSQILAQYGYTSSTIPVQGVLHLKTGITYIEQDTFVTTAEFVEHFAEFAPIQVSPQEAYAANCLRINERVLLPSGFPQVKQTLLKCGFSLIELELSEFEKMDGGLTCLSLLF